MMTVRTTFCGSRMDLFGSCFSVAEDRRVRNFSCRWYNPLYITLWERNLLRDIENSKNHWRHSKKRPQVTLLLCPPWLLDGLVVQSCLTVCDPLDCHRPPTPRLLWPWNFPGKNTGMGCHFLLQGIFLTQVSNPHLLWFLPWLGCSESRLLTQLLFSDLYSLVHP